MQERGDGRLLGQLVELVHKLRDAGGVHLAGFRHKDHVLLHVARGLVVLAVRDLPGEVGDQEGGVADPPDGVVDDFRGRESLVSALVSQDPQPGAEETLDYGVHRPERRTSWCRGDIGGRNEGVEEVEGRSEAGEVAGDVVETEGRVALEALLGDGPDDVAHGVVWELELIAVGVD